MCTIQAKLRCGVNLCRCLGSSTRVGAQEDDTSCARAAARTISSICGCISGSPPAIETIGAPHLLDRADRLLDRHALLEQRRGLLDLAAARALEVAGEQRLELDEQRELVAPAQLLLEQVGPELRRLWRSGMPIRSAHLLGQGESDVSSADAAVPATVRAEPGAARRRRSSTRRGGAEAPAVTPIRGRRRASRRSSSDGSSTGTPGVPRRARPPRRAAASWRSWPSRRRAPGRRRAATSRHGVLPVGGGVADVVGRGALQRRGSARAAPRRCLAPRRRRAWSASRRRPARVRTARAATSVGALARGRCGRAPRRGCPRPPRGRRGR